MAKAASKGNTNVVPAVPAKKGTVIKAEDKQLPLPFAAAEDAGAGFEEAGREAFAIPFLVVLQAGSPQVKKSDGAYIKGAQEGMILDTAARKVFDGDSGVVFIPCAYTRTFVEWKLREQGGGFVAEYDNTTGSGLQRSCKRDDKNRDILPSGNQLNDNRNHYVLYQDPETGTWSPALLSLTSTQIRASRNFMTALDRVRHAHNVAMFANKCRLTTTPQSNDKGSWYGVDLAVESLVDEEEVYDIARQFYRQAASGTVRTQAREEAQPGGHAVDNPDDM